MWYQANGNIRAISSTEKIRLSFNLTLQVALKNQSDELVDWNQNFENKIDLIRLILQVRLCVCVTFIKLQIILFSIPLYCMFYENKIVSSFFRCLVVCVLGVRVVNWLVSKINISGPYDAWWLRGFSCSYLLCLSLTGGRWLNQNGKSKLYLE